MRDFFAVAKNDQAQKLRATLKQLNPPWFRDHYGPLDSANYHVLAYLDSKKLIGKIVKQKNSFIITLISEEKRKGSRVGG